MSKNSFETLTLNTPGITDFAKSRNDLLKKSKSEWVFFLDTDEKMSRKLRKEILKKIQDDSYNGFYVKRDNYFVGQYSGTDNIVRLGKTKSGKWERSVHEVWKIPGRIGQLNNPIIHNTAGTVSEMITKINFYSTLHAKANKKEGKRSNLFKIIFFPKIKFLQSLIMGRGTVLSILQAFHSFLGWAKQWEIQN